MSGQRYLQVITSGALVLSLNFITIEDLFMYT